MSKRLVVVLVAAGLIISSVPVSAHKSFTKFGVTWAKGPAPTVSLSSRAYKPSGIQMAGRLGSGVNVHLTYQIECSWEDGRTWGDTAEFDLKGPWDTFFNRTFFEGAAFCDLSATAAADAGPKLKLMFLYKEAHPH